MAFDVQDASGNRLWTVGSWSDLIRCARELQRLNDEDAHYGYRVNVPDTDGAPRYFRLREVINGRLG